MRKTVMALALALGATGSGCVQTRQFADVQFTPPQGDYRLLVMRPDVQVNALTTGGMAQPRADWTEQARANIIQALRTEQADRGGKVLVLSRRNELPGISADEVADLERLNFAVGQSIALHKYSGASLPTKHALELRMPVGEIETRYGARPEGSHSKLSTFGDGWRILKTIVTLYRIERPVLFFGGIGALLLLAAILLAIPLVLTYLQTGLVPRFPTAILVTGMTVTAVLCFFAGLILDTVTRGRREMRRLAYLAFPAPGSQQV